MTRECMGCGCRINNSFIVVAGTVRDRDGGVWPVKPQLFFCYSCGDAFDGQKTEAGMNGDIDITIVKTKYVNGEVSTEEFVGEEKS